MPPAPFELRLDSVSAAMFSGDTRNAGSPDIGKVQFRAQGSGNHDLYVDDVYVCDTSGAQNNDFLGDVRVETLRPDADTAQADWTPSTGTDHYAVVDDAPGYDGADYVESDTAGHVDLWEYGDLGSTPQSIHAVQLVTAMQKTDAGTREARALLKSGTTTANGATRQLSTTWEQFEDLHETDPDTGAGLDRGRGERAAGWC
jgi:hypothetical protein